MSEARTQNEIRLALGRDAVLFRNNVGTAWTGDVQRLIDGSVLIKNPRIFHGGLCKGSSDLIGWRSIEVTPAMVGKQIAIFSAVEVKAPKGRATVDQVTFLDNVTRAGGLGCLAYSVDDAKRGLAIPVK